MANFEDTARKVEDLEKRVIQLEKEVAVLNMFKDCVCKLWLNTPQQTYIPITAPNIQTPYYQTPPQVTCNCGKHDK